jgi:acetyl-CoA C-acetyltransferase
MANAWAIGKCIDSMIVDGLWDVYNQYHMGITAENVAKASTASRARCRTHWPWPASKRHAAAQDAGKFKPMKLWV